MPINSCGVGIERSGLANATNHNTTTVGGTSRYVMYGAHNGLAEWSTLTHAGWAR